MKADILHGGKERPRNNYSAQDFWRYLDALCAEQWIITNIYRSGGDREGEKEVEDDVLEVRWKRSCIRWSGIIRQETGYSDPKGSSLVSWFR